jgi:hypothetical protein
MNEKLTTEQAAEDAGETVGFTVKKVADHPTSQTRPDELGDPKYVYAPIDPPHWTVELEDQDGRSWPIAFNLEGEFFSSRGLPHAEAVAKLERFIAEAQQALKALRNGEEFGVKAD